MAKPRLHLGNTWMIDTLDLLQMDESITGKNKVYIMVEGVCRCDKDGNLDTSGQPYFFEEHTCPWNYLRFPISVNGDPDPHGIFRWVASIPLPDDYEGDGNFEQYFPVYKGDK